MLAMKIAAVLALLAGFLVAGCSTSSGSPANDASSSSSASISSSTPAPVRVADPNKAACTAAMNYVFSDIQPTFKSWNVNAHEFDARVGKELRNEGTHLYSIQGRASGPTAAAIGGEATGLTNISIAIDEADDAALGKAANAANSSLAQLRGVCNF